MKWEIVRLGDYCIKIGSGATPKGGATVYIEDGVTLIRSQNVYNLFFEYDGLTHITDDAAEKLNGVTIFPDDILLNITGDSVARVCMVPTDVLPARVNQHVAIIRTRKDLLPQYLLYYLASPYMQAYMLNLAVGKGASRNALTKGMIEDFPMPLPSVEGQRRIIEILSPYSNLIKNNQKQIKLLEEAAQRLYKEWFVDLRFPGHETIPIVDGVPEGWKVDRADTFFNMSIGKTPPRAEKQWFTDGDKGTPWISISDMGNSGTYIFHTTEGLTAEAISKHNVRVVPADTILVSFKLTVGRVSITTTNTCTNEAIAHFLIPDGFLREYTYLYLKCFEYDSLGNTSAISKAVNSKIIKAMPFVMPDSEILQRFHQVGKPILEEIKNKQKTNICLAEARDRLLPKLMSGEIEV